MLNIKSLKLDCNYGLGLALNEGLNACEHEIVARMDTDDIAVKDRFEKQISFLIDNSKSIDNWKDIVDIKNSISNFENNNLSNIKFDYYLFGDSLRKIENLSSINYSDNTTNYYSLFSQINKINSDEFILLSDGIQTSGFYYNKNWNNNKIINTWGIGEKISAQDIAIKDVVIDTAYKDSLFITLKVNSILNASREINIYLKNKIIEKKNIFFCSSSWRIYF